MPDLNWIDFLILILLLLYALEGYYVGFLRGSLDLISFILSFLFGLKFYGFFAGILVDKFSIPQGFSNAIGFFIAAFIIEVIVSILIKSFLSFHITRFKTANHILGILPGLLSSLILISFLSALIVALPVSSSVKDSILSSKISKVLIIHTQGIEKDLNNIFGRVASETLNFITVEPQSNKIVKLNFKTASLKIDQKAENYMFELVNIERKKAGLNELVVDEDLRSVARSHCKDMFERGYFSHYTPEGFSPFDRMTAANIDYKAAGENLALSPNTDIAMQGLMNSPGHKANILSVNFGTLGVGVIDGGIYGEMFCQEFTD